MQGVGPPVDSTGCLNPEGGKVGWSDDQSQLPSLQCLISRHNDHGIGIPPGKAPTESRPPFGYFGSIFFNVVHLVFLSVINLGKTNTIDVLSHLTLFLLYFVILFVSITIKFFLIPTFQNPCLFFLEAKQTLCSCFPSPQNNVSPSL